MHSIHCVYLKTINSNTTVNYFIMHLVDFKIAGRVTVLVECHAVLTIYPAACTIFNKEIQLLEIMHENQQPPLSWSHPCSGSPSHPYCCSITREEQLLCSLPLRGQKYLNIFLLPLHVFFFQQNAK